MAHSVLLKALDNGSNFRIDRPVVLVGRNPDCDIILDSKKISRHHCCIARMPEHLVVRDLNSTNGIRINGQLSAEGSCKSGDELTIGNLRFQIEMDGESETAQGWGGSKPPREISDSLIERSELPIPLADGPISISAEPAPKKPNFNATEESEHPDRPKSKDERAAKRTANHPEKIIAPDSGKPLLDPDADIDLAAYF